MPANKLSTWSQLESSLELTQFESFGELCSLVTRPEGEPVDVMSIIDPAVGVPDDNGFIKETRCEIALPAKLALMRGQRVIQPGGKGWDLLKLVSNDGHEQVWVAVPTRG